MQLSPLFLLFILTGTNVAVNLVQYTRPNCYGAKRLCRNVGPITCCQSTSRYFSSGNCEGCTSTDFHFIWAQSGRNFCGRNVKGINSNRCISGANLRGHTWCRLCGTLAAPDEAIPRPEAESCTSYVAPDVATKDDVVWVDISTDVAEADREALEDWLDAEAEPDLPQHLMQYQVSYTDEVGNATV